MPPRHQPTSCTGRPPASSDDGAHGLRDHVLDPVLEPERAVAEADPAVVDEVGLVARAASRCSASEQPRRRSKHSAGAASGGTSSTGARAARRRAAPQRQVAVHARAAAPRRSAPTASGAGRRARRGRSRRRGSPPRRDGDGEGMGSRSTAMHDDATRVPQGRPRSMSSRPATTTSARELPAGPVGPAAARPGPRAGAHRAGRRRARSRRRPRAWAAEKRARYAVTRRTSWR